MSVLQTILGSKDLPTKIDEQDGPQGYHFYFIPNN